MFATAVTLAVIAIAARSLADLAKHDGAKILAAIQGRPWAAEPRPRRPMTVSVRPTYRAAAPARLDWRAAA